MSSGIKHIVFLGFTFVMLLLLGFDAKTQKWPGIGKYISDKDKKTVEKALDYLQEGSVLIQQANDQFNEALEIQSDLSKDEKSIQKEVSRLETEALQRQEKADRYYTKAYHSVYDLIEENLEKDSGQNKDQVSEYKSKAAEQLRQAEDKRKEAKDIEKLAEKASLLNNASELEASAVDNMLIALKFYNDDPPENLTPDQEYYSYDDTQGNESSEQVLYPDPKNESGSEVKVNEDAISKYESYVTDYSTPDPITINRNGLTGIDEGVDINEARDMYVDYSSKNEINTSSYTSNSSAYDSYGSAYGNDEYAASNNSYDSDYTEYSYDTSSDYDSYSTDYSYDTTSGNNTSTDYNEFADTDYEDYSTDYTETDSNNLGAYDTLGNYDYTDNAGHSDYNTDYNTTNDVNSEYIENETSYEDYSTGQGEVDSYESNIESTGAGSNEYDHYGTDNMQPGIKRNYNSGLPPIAIPGIRFTVQLAASKSPLNKAQIYAIYPGNAPIQIIKENGWFIYGITGFRTFEEADRVSRASGVASSWVLSRENGKMSDLQQSRDAALKNNVEKSNNAVRTDYYIQVAASRSRLAESQARTVCESSGKCREIIEEDWYKYQIYAGNSYQEALETKKNLNVKSFVTAYHNGVKIKLYKTVK